MWLQLDSTALFLESFETGFILSGQIAFASDHLCIADHAAESSYIVAELPCDF